MSILSCHQEVGLEKGLYQQISLFFSYIKYIVPWSPFTPAYVSDTMLFFKFTIVFQHSSINLLTRKIISDHVDVMKIKS